MDGYIPRVIDVEIDHALAAAGALEIRGPRAVGKTESARRVAASELRLDSSDPRARLAREQPASALAGDTPRLLDEWQLVPDLWNEVRRAVDDRRAAGQFIMCGSAVPADDALRHPGAGRFRRVTMRTMTLAESGESTGAVSLKSLLVGEPLTTVESATDFTGVVGRLVSGGWPGWLGLPEASARQRALDYVTDLSEHDFARVAGARRDPRRLSAYARAIAALIAQPAPYAAITGRMAEVVGTGVTGSAGADLHSVAQRLYLVEDQPAWSPQLRSRSAATQTPKRHLADPSLAAALLGAGTDRLLAEPETLGFLFESQVVHDLRVFAQAAGTRGVFHYRDTKGRDEIDAIIETADGSWLAVEVKLGASAIAAAAANLQRVTAKFVRPPVAHVVIIPSGISYRREDGVLVVPLSVLGA